MIRILTVLGKEIGAWSKQRLVGGVTWWNQIVECVLIGTMGSAIGLVDKCCKRNTFMFNLATLIKRIVSLLTENILYISEMFIIAVFAWKLSVNKNRKRGPTESCTRFEFAPSSVSMRKRPMCIYLKWTEGSEIFDHLVQYKSLPIFLLNDLANRRKFGSVM